MRTKFKNCGPSAESANFDASKISTFTVCPMIITVNVEIFDGCLISFFSSLDSTHEIKYIRGCTCTW